MAQQKVDVVLGNLEDNISPDEKVAARRGFIKFAQETEMGDTGLWTRVNPFYNMDGTKNEWGEDDVREIVTAVGEKLDTIMLPMVNSAEDIKRLHKTLTMLEAELGIKKPIRIHAIIETAEGLRNINEIASASPRMHGMSFGPADFAANMGIKTQDVGGGHPLYGVLNEIIAGGSSIQRTFSQQDIWHYAVNAMVTACRSEGLKPMYGPYGNFKDDAGCETQFRNTYIMGCEGAWTLHPRQVAIAHNVFTPTLEEYKLAVKRVSEFEANGQKGYYEEDSGKFVDDAVAKQAMVFKDMYELIAAKEPELARAANLTFEPKKPPAEPAAPAA